MSWVFNIEKIHFIYVTVTWRVAMPPRLPTHTSISINSVSFNSFFSLAMESKLIRPSWSVKQPPVPVCCLIFIWSLCFCLSHIANEENGVRFMTFFLFSHSLWCLPWSPFYLTVMLCPRECLLLCTCSVLH